MKFGFQFEKHWDAKIGVLRRFAKKETQKWKKVDEMKRQQNQRKQRTTNPSWKRDSPKNATLHLTI